MRKGMSGGSYDADYRSKRNIIFVNFELCTDPWGLGVMRNETRSDGRIQRREIDGFGDHGGNDINRVLARIL